MRTISIILLAVILSGCASFDWGAVGEELMNGGGGETRQPDVTIYICTGDNPCAEASR